MLLVFQTVFPVSVISQIEFIEGGEWEGGGMGGGNGRGAKGGVKHPFRLKGQCCAFSK